MKVHLIDYSLKTKSLDIFLSGCSKIPKCSGCHNPELWDFSSGRNVDENTYKKIRVYIEEFDTLINNVFILGGEPLDQQPDEFKLFIQNIKKITKDKKLWLFTRFNLEEVDKNIYSMFDYIKTGEYLPKLKCSNNLQYGVTLATSNQKIYKVIK